MGADKRAFKYLTFPENCIIRYVEWADYNGCKGIPDYAIRLKEQIITNENNVFIGLSFGGMVAQEVARIIRPDQLILISTTQSRKEIPLLYRLMGYSGVQFLLPASFLQKNPITFKLFGIKSERDKRLLQKILDDTDLKFLKWAIIACLKWNPQDRLKAYHIHGDSDKIVPLKWVTPNEVIGGGGHFMVVDKAEEVSEILRSKLKRR